MPKKKRVIGIFINLVDAELARAFLQSYGIEAEVENKYIVGVQWLYSNAVGGLRLMVDEDYADKAELLLQDVHGDKFKISDNEVAGSICPKCSSNKTERSSSPGRSIGFLMLIAFPLIALFPFFDYEKWTCTQCEHKWKFYVSRSIFFRALMFFLVLMMICYFSLVLV